MFSQLLKFVELSSLTHKRTQRQSREAVNMQNFLFNKRYGSQSTIRQFPAERAHEFAGIALSSCENVGARKLQGVSS